jgi:hypothetical protein
MEALMASPEYYERVQKLLASHNAGTPIEELMRATGWQRASIRTILSRARRGLIKPGRVSRGGWTDDADAIVRLYWTTENGHQIAARLKRLRPGTDNIAVNKRAGVLCLGKKPGYPSAWWTESPR